MAVGFAGFLFFASINYDHYIHHEVSDIAGGLEHLAVMPCSIRIDNFQFFKLKIMALHETKYALVE